jgi:selenocysteine-specific elongation factor
VHFRLLPDIAQPLKHDTSVKFYLGAAEVQSRVRLLGSEELLPGDEGWLQLELETPVVALRGDRYILRRPSPGETLGGGAIIDPHPKGRHKRFSNQDLVNLEMLSRGTPTEILLQAMLALGIAPIQEVIKRSNIESENAFQITLELISTGDIIALDNPPENKVTAHSLVISKNYWNQIKRQILQELTNYHKSYPLRRGIPREELKSRVKLPVHPFNDILHILATEGELKESGSLVLLARHTIQFSPAQQRSVDALLVRFAKAPYSPPTVKECQSEVGEELYNAMIDLGMLFPIPPDVVFRKQDYDLMVSEIIQLLKEKQTISAAEVRDHLNTSRRYVLALLEYLDSIGITVREGDTRRLK